uniref:Uncharacterized protein n=1 Tax=Rousettus aegyptiacus TaxID=9407 RepID=A0A7J8IM83_ROUAE|nr:hypothetical protein HJG63_010618 [Rousettus aegyptiacus]
MFSSMQFIVSGLIFRSLIYYELILVYGDRQQSIFILLHRANFPSMIYWKCLFLFFHCIFLAPLSKICPYICVYLWVLNSVPLIFVSVFLPIQLCFDYCHFVVKFEVRKCDISRLILFFSGLLSQFRVFCASYKSDNFLFYFFFKMPLDFYGNCIKTVYCFG